MAKNWTLKEAVVEITKGTNKEAIQELGKKFPLTSIAIAKAGSNAGIETLFGGMPEHMTMLKMERSLKEGISEAADEDEDINATSDAAEDAADEVTGDVDYNTMTTKQLYELCVKKGLKVSKYGKPKSYYIEQLTGATADEDELEEADEAEEVSAYDDMSAVELFKLCKKRGIKTEPKKKASVYIALLQKADAAVQADDEEEDEDWGDEEAEEKPTKKASVKKQPAKKENKPTKKAESDDEEEDWDI